MNQQPHPFLPVDSQCVGCSKEVFSEIDSDDDELPDHLLEHFYDKSRSAKRQEISTRPCYHCRLETPLVAFNVAILQLTHDLIDKLEHIPNTLVFTEKCSPDDLYNLLGCTRESTDIVTNIIVFKFDPEDIEDENPTEKLYEHLVVNKSFTFTKLRCDLFSELYILPLPKENEPPAFLPITSRLNLESCPREENILLGVIVKRPPLEEGEISAESNQTPVEADSPNFSEILSPVSPNQTDEPPSSSKLKSPSPNKYLSPSTLEKSKSGLDANFKLMPADRYGSYIGASTEDIPFLTDPVATLHSVTTNKTKSTSITSLNELTEEISDSESEPGTKITIKSTASRKRTLQTPTASQSDPKLTNIQNKQTITQRASSSVPNILSSSSSTTTSQTTSKITTNQSKLIASTSKNPIINTSPKKPKMSAASNVIDIESSESDPDSDLFPRQPNNAMTGIFVTSMGDFEFKYYVIKSDRPEVKKYLPLTLTVKGRARALDCENALLAAKLKPNVKIILFQILPRETLEDKRIFGNYATYLVNRDRYGLLDYKPEAYRAYILPVVKGSPAMKIFEILKLKPKGKYSHELYGLIIKKSAMVNVVQAAPQVSAQASRPSTSTAGPSATQAQATSSTIVKFDKIATESSEFHSTNLKAKFGPENFPQLDVYNLANLIHSTADDLISLSEAVAILLKKTIGTDANPKRKLEATSEFQSKVIFIKQLEEQQHARRKQAYEMILSWLKTLSS